ncbi:MAG: hypothetical protein ACRENL_11410 [Candidatus Dormibacteria bacterium]
MAKGRKLAFDLGGALALWFDRPGRELVTEAVRAVTPRRTGKLAERTYAVRRTALGRMTIEVRSDRMTEGRSPRPLVPLILGGTPPHTITAVNAKALHFTGKSGEVFTRSVRHPGTRPNRYDLKARARMASIIAPSLREAVVVELRGAA